MVENPVRKPWGMSVATRRVRLFNGLHHEEAGEKITCDNGDYQQLYWLSDLFHAAPAVLP
jgi:hypothetical protein